MYSTFLISDFKTFPSSQVLLETHIFVGIVLLVSFLSYSYIAWRSTHRDAMNTCRIRRRKTFVPLCIVLIFTVFYVTPNTVNFVVGEGEEWGEKEEWGRGGLYYHVIALILSDVCCAGDALVYILSDTCTRKRFFELVTCGLRNRRKLTIQDTLIRERRVTLTRVQRTKSFRQNSYYDTIDDDEDGDDDYEGLEADSVGNMVYKGHRTAV